MIDSSHSIGLSSSVCLGEAVVWAATVLQTAGCDSPRLDAELLLASSLGITRSQLHVRWRDHLMPATSTVFHAYIQRRQLREPLAYILSQRAFYDMVLEVGPATLVPRPETEQLVDEAINWCRQQGKIELWAADVGTGSGALAIALAKHIPNLHVHASDHSNAALAIAERNIRRYSLQDRIRVSVGDLLIAAQRRFDVIVANLPYLPRTRLVELSPEVTQYEPLVALDGGEGGLDIITRMCHQVPEYLERSGLLLLEIDEGQGEIVTGLLAESLPLAQVQVLLDYAGLQRVVRAEIAI
ncbi:MAG: peptide chain release factor N(5)-glutamine methyltransferase [Anaerolineae bacterium]